MASAKGRAGRAAARALGSGLWQVVALLTAPLPSWSRRNLRDEAFAAVRSAHLHQGEAWTTRLGYDEADTRAYIAAELRDGDVFWDIGANVGEFALHGWRSAPGARVIAFEPVLANFFVLVERIRAAGAEGAVTPLPIALSARAALTAIQLSSVGAASVRNVLDGGTDQYGNSPAAGRQPVLAITADDLVERFDVPPPTHLKLDVDGLEPDILAGAQRALGQARTALIEVKGRYASDPTPIEAPLHAAGLVEDMAFRERWGGENRLFRRPA